LQVCTPSQSFPFYSSAVIKSGKAFKTAGQGRFQPFRFVYAILQPQTLNAKHLCLPIVHDLRPAGKALPIQYISAAYFLLFDHPFIGFKIIKQPDLLQAFLSFHHADKFHPAGSGRPVLLRIADTLNPAGTQFMIFLQPYIAGLYLSDRIKGGDDIHRNPHLSHLTFFNSFS
jgi:hypothetical protein